MFPFQRSCELSFKIKDEDNPSENEYIEDEIMFDTNASVGPGNINRGRGRGRGRARGRRSGSLASSSGTNNNNVNEVDDEKKRVFHRDNERQRRLDMSSLFDSLRSVISADQSKGRKSITDHLAEATNYIKDLKKNVKELGEKRDRLKQSIGSTSRSGNELGGSSNLSPPYSIEIRQFTGVLEIEICVNYDNNDDEFLLSTVLQVVLEEGLDVVSSTSTKLNDKFLHNIQCEVSDVTSIDLNRVEQRLNDLFDR